VKCFEIQAQSAEKAFARLSRKAAGSRGSAPGRAPQGAKSPPRRAPPNSSTKPQHLTFSTKHGAAPIAPLPRKRQTTLHQFPSELPEWYDLINHDGIETAGKMQVVISLKTRRETEQKSEHLTGNQTPLAP